MLKYLRITVTVLSLVACMLLIALWVRSYWWVDYLRDDASTGLGSHWFALASDSGRLGYFSDDNRIRWPLHLDEYRKHPSSWHFYDMWQFHRNTTMWAYRTDMLGNYVYLNIIIPHWFPVVLTGTFAAVLGIRRPFHFSLRTLLVAMTIIAAWLGFIVAIV